MTWLASKFCELSFYSNEKLNFFCLLCLPFSQSSHVFTWWVWNNGLRNNVSIPYWMGLDHLIIFCFTSSLNQDTKTWFQIFALWDIHYILWLWVSHTYVSHMIKSERLWLRHKFFVTHGNINAHHQLVSMIILVQLIG